ncbi:MAG: hypothetical protein EOP39_17825 [Rubrivivax sp.]|nr:MAG: hypothetical protein EOP39_17825 [Rubrivivax sp.]
MRHGQRSARRWLLLPALAVPVALVAGVVGGLVRAGVAVPAVAGPWLGAAVLAHAFLMICVVLGTAIAIERAVAVRHPLAFVGPVVSASAGAVQLAGAGPLAAWLVAGASLAFVAVSAVIVQRQRAAHTWLLLVGAVCWAVGSVGHASSAAVNAVAWWFAFLVLTIAAERLEMTRLMRRRPVASWALYAILGVLLLGAAASGVLFGLALAALAVWLLMFDIARRTVRTHGLSRYMAVCLLLGYGWLLVSGLAWAATALGWPWRDAALHGLGLGFVVSMVFGHAPVILPAIARVKLRFGWAWYLPLALLHLSLAVRLFGGSGLLAVGAACNALAIATFVATVVGAAFAWRHQHRGHVQGTRSP